CNIKQKIHDFSNSPKQKRPIVEITPIGGLFRGKRFYCNPPQTIICHVHIIVEA
ncbi:hypothetical protein XENOCAPTIV_010394, partial [Xenoophorus captivus]